MAIGAGLSSQLGIAKESTYGTRVAPAKFFEYNSEGLQLTRNRIASRGLRAGRSFQQSANRVTTTRSAGGTVAMEVPIKGFGSVLDFLAGGTVTPVQQTTTTAYLSTFDIGTTTEPTKSATIQIGKPGTDGTVRPFDYVGAMCTEWEFGCEVDGFLTASLGWDARDEKTDQTLGTASYAAGSSPFHFGQATTVTVNGVSVTDRVQSFSLSGSTSRKYDRFFLGSSGLKSRPIQNDYQAATLSLGGEFKDLTDYGLYTADTVFAVVITFEGATIEATHKYTFSITCQACQMDGDTPTVEGPDVLSQPLNIMVLDNGTNPPVKIEYKSTDTAL